MTNNNGSVRLMLNDFAPRGHFLTVELDGRKTNRMGLGAEVILLRPGAKPLLRCAWTNGSYLAPSDSRVHFRLGADARIDGVVVRWNGGAIKVWRNIKADRFIRLHEGDGAPAETPY